MDAKLPEFLAPGVQAVAQTAHFIGIHGAGMRSLSRLLAGFGWEVTGSDPMLASSSAGRFQLHAPDNVPEHADVVVCSDAIAADHCERQRAAELGIETISYADMLGRLMLDRTGVAVAGTHGKSTVTAMTGEILLAAGLDPSIVVGAEPIACQRSGRAGSSPLLVAEACEYRRNFLKLRPRCAAILNVEPDHFDCYAQVDELTDAFGQFAAQVHMHGRLIVNEDSPRAVSAARRADCPTETFGFEPSADWSPRFLLANNGFYDFDLCHQSRSLGRVRLRVAGRHQVANALAAAALAAAAGAHEEAILVGLSRFAGLERRLELAGMPGGVNWIDDYAHHPTEVAAAIETLREMMPISRLWCVFQPHQASRTAGLLEEFAETLRMTDRVAILDVFRAREGAPAPGEVTAADLAERIRDLDGRVIDVHAADAVEQTLAEAIEVGELTRGDIIITMGAGDVGRIGAGLSKTFSTRRMAG
ncbi:MAG: UDP-N-acetylmuramate--L-alanine ligase [Planctomycetales bacterium]|nr:UDP-N-acetylmuramate--L-alanine ligase [Planctomycetales bacterium]